jgi:hypothetical protein
MEEVMPVNHNNYYNLTADRTPYGARTFHFLASFELKIKITRILKNLFSCFLILVFFSGCGSPGLEPVFVEPIRPQMTLEGSFLTESPDEINFPVKVLFAIDCSLSMGDEEQGIEAGSDPHFLRIEAVRNFITQYNSNENTSFEILLWSSNVFDATRTSDGQRGFTKDPEELNRVLDGAYNDTTTDYLGTLDAIQADIQRDINRANEDDLIRSKYIVIFLSDGLSNAQGVTQDDTDIWGSINDITQMTVDNGIGSFNFHTFLLLGMFPPGSEGDDARNHAENTLQGMADRGNGEFRLFENAESVDFLNIVDMRLTVEYHVKYLLVYNYNVRPGTRIIHVDSDRDGLLDTEETEYGTNPANKDSDGDGLSDFFEISVSSPGHELDPLTADSPCTLREDGDYPDSDNDGLTDCEEFVKGTDRRISDSDGDGIPDGIEFREGTNPLESQPSFDSDFDGMVDWLEIQRHTNTISNDPLIKEKYSYTYDINDEGLVPLDQGTDMESYVRRYSFRIANIDLLDTATHSRPDGTIWNQGDNLIRFYIAEVPEDTPDVPPIFRMAEVIVNANMNIANQVITLTPSDFNLLN